MLHQPLNCLRRAAAQIRCLPKGNVVVTIGVNRHWMSFREHFVYDRAIHYAKAVHQTYAKTVHAPNWQLAFEDGL